jgi:lysylphosphatidylglycerol synthetase-like protein (DUF2156 family)
MNFRQGDDRYDRDGDTFEASSREDAVAQMAETFSDWATEWLADERAKRARGEPSMLDDMTEEAARGAMLAEYAREYDRGLQSTEDD